MFNEKILKESMFLNESNTSSEFKKVLESLINSIKKTKFYKKYKKDINISYPKSNEEEIEFFEWYYNIYDDYNAGEDAMDEILAIPGLIKIKDDGEYISYYNYKGHIVTIVFDNKHIYITLSTKKKNK